MTAIKFLFSTWVRVIYEFISHPVFRQIVAILTVEAKNDSNDESLTKRCRTVVRLHLHIQLRFFRLLKGVAFMRSQTRLIGKRKKDQIRQAQKMKNKQPIVNMRPSRAGFGTA